MNETQKGVILKLRVLPNSPCFKLGEFSAAKNELRVKVCSPPRNGKANKELLKELKKIFNSSAEILKGEKSNKKLVLAHAGMEQVLAALNKAGRP